MFMFSLVMLYKGYDIFTTKSIDGHRGSPDLYLGNFAYIIAAVFVYIGFLLQQRII